SWRIGSQLFVFICDFKLIKEAFQSQTFADRPNVSFINLFGEQDLGVLASNGIHWHNIRKFTLRHLRDLGMGKSKIVSSVQREANELVKVMKKQSGKAAPVPHEISTAIINILWQMVAATRSVSHGPEPTLSTPPDSSNHRDVSNDDVENEFCQDELRDPVFVETLLLLLSLNFCCNHI
ncbi:cytochrome P450 2L1, partial [Armadillidium vulgare]